MLYRFNNLADYWENSFDNGKKWNYSYLNGHFNFNYEKIKAHLTEKGHTIVPYRNQNDSPYKKET